MSDPGWSGGSRQVTPPPESPVYDWVPTHALRRAVTMVCLLLVVGVVAGRVDVVVIALPFAIGTAWALRRRPTALPAAAVRLADAAVPEGDDVGVTISVGNPEGAGGVAYDIATVRVSTSPWLRLEGGRRTYVAPVPPGQVADIGLAGPMLRWGRHRVGQVVAQAAACDALLWSRPVAAGPLWLRAYPATHHFDADDAMPRAAGLTGAHRSRRPGDGGELAGVRLFAPGDRLRRIDWRVSLRTRQLHVASTLSDRDAEVVLLLDVLSEAGVSGGVRGSASVLDVTVRAAAGIARHYLHRGDRVSLVEYTARMRRLRPASGRRQYLAALEWLLDVAPPMAGFEPNDRMFGAHVLSPDALVVVLTPLLDLTAAETLAGLARAGRFLVAVDTLPFQLTPPRSGDWSEVAFRLWRLERDNTIEQLREHGIPVVPWQGAGSLDVVLRDVSRMAVANRGVPR